MIFEIRGTHFQNKGAELMLAAAASAITEMGHIPAIYPWSGSYQKRARYGLFQLMWYQRFGIPWSRFPTPFPKRLRRQYGLLKPSEVDVFLDASGFKYSDQWGERVVKDEVKYYERQVNQSRKLIMLPQAFGPFQNVQVRVAFKRIFDISDIIYARDDASYNHLIETYGYQNKIKKSTDFTLLLDGVSPEEDFFMNPGRKVCIVPNYRMIDKSDRETSDAYLQFMINATRTARDFGLDPFILIHEKGTDDELAKEIKSNSGIDVPIFYEDDPIKIKGKINCAELFIGSRFHGLVSALSQGIPAIGTGWSHKYKMLFRDYRCEKYLVNPATSVPAKIVEEIICDDNLRPSLSNIAIEKKNEVREMWSEIFNHVQTDSDD